MRKIFTISFVSVCVLLSLQVKAQQDFYQTHFMLNKLSYNPATAGEVDAICAKLLGHQQWGGMEEGLKKFDNTLDPGKKVGIATQTFSITMPMLKNKMGLGVQVINDKIAYENALNLKVSLSYMHRFGRMMGGVPSQTLAVGIDGGFLQKGLDGSQLRAQTPNDPNIPAALVSGLKPDLGFGVQYRNEMFYKLYAGLSVTHLMGGKLTYNWPGGGMHDGKIDRHLYLVAGSEFNVGANGVIAPSILVKSDFRKTQVDFAARYIINQKFVGGLCVRTQDAIAPMLGYYIQPNFYVGYSYDINVFSKPVRQYTNAGTHELFVSYCFVLKSTSPPTLKKRLTPRYLNGYTMDRFQNF